MLLEGQEVLMAQDSLPVLRVQDMEKKERLAFVFVLGACCSWFAMTPTTRFLPLPRDNCFNLNCVLLFKHLLHLLNLPLLITVQIQGSCSDLFSAFWLWCPSMAARATVLTVGVQPSWHSAAAMGLPRGGLEVNLRMIRTEPSAPIPLLAQD